MGSNPEEVYTAIGTLYKRSQPETAKIVETALRPILVSRAQAKRKPTVDLDGDGVPDAPADDEALAEQEDGATIDDNQVPGDTEAEATEEES
jgi:hypothetical protein